VSHELSSIRKRFESNLNTFETKVNSLTTNKLFGVWSEELPKLMKSILDSFKIDLQENVFTSSDDDMKEILATLNHRLDSLASLIETTLNTLCKNSSMHEFISSILRDLEVQEKAPYLICVRHSLETVQIITSCALYFKGPLYPHVNETLTNYQEKFDDFSIIFIPPTVLENKKYWSLIMHEIGHILNEIHRLTVNYNERVERPSPFNQDFRNYYHGREFISDYIANLYCGPVYYESLSEYLSELDVLPAEWELTHPIKEARLFFLQKVLGTLVNNPTEIKTMPTISNHTLVENLDKIINDTNDIVFEKQETKYHEDVDELKKVAEHLKILIPYIGPPRILLNGYAKHYSEIIETIQKETKQDPIEISNNVGKIIEDSIRLTNMKRTFNSTE